MLRLLAVLPKCRFRSTNLNLFRSVCLDADGNPRTPLRFRSFGQYVHGPPLVMRPKCAISILSRAHVLQNLIMVSMVSVIGQPTQQAEPITRLVSIERHVATPR